MPATMIEINPNLRSPSDETMASLDDVHGPINFGFEVVVYEPTSGLIGRGWVTDVDREEGDVTVLVDWSNLTTLPETLAASGLEPLAETNRSIAHGVHVAA